MLGKKHRSELEHVQRTPAGALIYTGPWYAWRGPGNRKNRLGLLWLIQGAGLLCGLAAGIPPVPGARDRAYVLLPYALWLLLAASALWSLGRLTFAGDPMREHVYETAAGSLPRRAAATAVPAFLTILGETGFLLRHGAEGAGGLAAAYLLLMLACGLAAAAAWRLSGKLQWEKLP